MNEFENAPILIVGAGPAGLQLADSLQEAGVQYRVLEAARPGATFEIMPRHRELISINKVHTGGKEGQERLRYDWNSLLADGERPVFPEYSTDYFPNADDYVRYLRDYADSAGLNICCGVRVDQISRTEGRYELHCSDEQTRTAARVVIATGFGDVHIPDIPGIEHAEQYADFDTDPEGFVDQRVLVLGKGNSAFETADALIPFASTIHLCSPNPIRFAWQSHYVGHLRAVNNNFLDTYQLKSQNAALDATVTRIFRREDGLYADLSYTHAGGHTTTIRYDRVICCTGFRIDDSIFSHSAAPELVYNGKFPAINSSYEAIGLPGLYFAGALSHGRDYRKHTSGFIHGFRYDVRLLADLLTGRLNPSLEGFESVRTEELSERVLARLNTASALFLQPGNFADVAVADSDGWLYIEDVTLGWMRDNAQDRRWISISLEFGPAVTDPFNIMRAQTEEYAEITPFLHPVVRLHYGPDVVDIIHLIEDVENTFAGDLVERPLTAFLARCGNSDSAYSAHTIAGTPGALPPLSGGRGN